MRRRDFIKASAAAGGLYFLPSRVLADAPNGKICTAHIGTGGKGSSDLRSIASHPKVQVVGLCDVDKARGNAAKNQKQFKGARFFQDYREMLAELGDKIDAVSISTPDHTHYPATLAAMNLGKHVYTQKPLVHKVAEARHLQKVAREKKLVTQMGIQVQSSVAYRMAVEYIQGGVIGKVSKVYVWSNKRWGHDGEPYKGEDPVPESVDWNLWQGTAPTRPYLKGKYHPANWRRILDYGCGTLGDMGVHIFDTPYRALQLGAPNWVETTCRKPNGFSHPTQVIVRYGFPETRYTTKELLWSWHDGGYSPPKGGPDFVMPEGLRLPKQGGLFIGEKGRLLLTHVAGPLLLPKALYKTMARPDIKPVDHYHSWVDAISGKGETTANFDYSGPLTEALLLGVVAAQFPGKRLMWDEEKMAVTNLAAANAFIKGKYRKY